jgi:ribosomal protein L31E
MASRLITIGIRKYLVEQPRTKRARKAVRYVRERIAHYTKTDEENVKLSTSLNELIIKRHAKSMLPVRASISVDKGVVTASPFSEQKAEPKQEVKKAEAAAAPKAKAPAQEPKEHDKQKAGA